MKKILLLLFLFLSFSHADFLYGKNDHCINDYYYKSGTFYFKRSDNNKWYYTSMNNYQKYIYPNFYYDKNSSKCIDKSLQIPQIGLDYSTYMFLLSLTGLLGGFAFLFSFLNIMSRR